MRARERERMEREIGSRRREKAELMLILYQVSSLGHASVPHLSVEQELCTENCPNTQLRSSTM